MSKGKLRSPGGMAVIASVGGPDPVDAPRASHDEIRVIPASDRQHQFECGHVGPELHDLDLFGQVMKNSGETPRKCGKCLEEKLRRDVTRCAVCGLVIFPGEGVAVYAPSPDFPPWATEVNGGVIGCLRMSCCPSGGFFAGHWTMEGFAPLLPDGGAAEECTPPGDFPSLCLSPRAKALLDEEWSDDLDDDDGHLHDDQTECFTAVRPPWYRRWFPWLFS